MFSVEALQILLFLIPGLYAMLFVNAFVARKKQPTDFDKLIESLVFSLFIYVAYSFFRRGFPGIGLNENNVPIMNGGELLLLLIVSTVVAMIVIYSAHNDWHMSFMRWIKASRLTVHATSWQEAFGAYQNHVIVTFEDGKNIAGYPRFYSEGSEASLVLTDPKLVTPEGVYQDMGFEALLLPADSGLKMVGFLKYPDVGAQDERKGKTVAATQTGRA